MSENTIHDGKFRYMPGFGNHFSSEAVANALPLYQNSPQRCAFDLYAEQLSGTAFTVPRTGNQRSWLYRIMPCVKHAPYKPYPHAKLVSEFGADCFLNPNQLRWKPLEKVAEKESVDFVDGLVTYCGSGSPITKSGLAVHMYRCNASMKNKAFCNSDGDMLIVPESGKLAIQTELGWLEVSQGEICVIQRGIRFRVVVEESSRGYICEVFNSHFRIPDLGPIGANCLANPRDFLTPVAAYDVDVEQTYQIVQKFGGKLFVAEQGQTPFDVVAWHGNYAPYKYNLANFCPVNVVGYDHADPSIFTVLTAPSGEPGVAVCDFAIFPPRWNVADHTFRPPYYHRNCMSEYMGLIKGVYEAKEEGFLPGGGSLHSCMIAHGPETEVFEKTSTMKLEPVKIPDTSLAFMFESTYIFKTTAHAEDVNEQDVDYYKCWDGLEPKAVGKLPAHAADNTFVAQ